MFRTANGESVALEGSVTAPDVITDCTFTGNVCAGHGGAISYVTPSHDLEVTDCTFSGNDARGTGGGAIWIEGDATITGSTFTTNLASAGGATIGRGGAIVMYSGISSVSGCTFTTNDAAGDGGGAIYYIGTNSILSDCTFDTNDASGGDGGGVYSEGNSPLDIVGCTFDSNTADGNGRGLYFGAAGENSDDMSLTNCLFVDNAADGSGSDGGAIYVIDTTPMTTVPTLTAINCTIVGNTATDLGGGVFINASAYNSGTGDVGFDAVNCIFYDNSDTGGQDESGQIHDDTGEARVTYCDIEACSLTGYCVPASGDENFGALPGFTGTGFDPYSLVALGGATNQGSNDAVDDAEIETDILGNDRKLDNMIGGTCDLTADCGAYEFEGTCPP